MKNNNLKKLVTSMGLSCVAVSALISVQANAGSVNLACTIPSVAKSMMTVLELGTLKSPQAGDCNETKNVYEFTGDAKSHIDTFGTEIEEAGKAIADAVSANAASEIEIIAKGNESLMMAMVNITNSQIKDQLKQDKMLLDMKMDYISELNERELKASQNVMGMDDTREEALFIIHELNVVGGGSEGAYNHSHEVIAAMKKKYDDDPTFTMPVRIKAAETTGPDGEGCAEYDPAAHKNGTLDGSCFYAVASKPGSKLEKYFKECSRLKTQSVAAVKKNLSKKVSVAAQKKSMSSYMNKSQTQKSDELIQTKMIVQKETSCSVKEFGYKICGKDENGDQITPELYLEKVMDLSIVPYGNVSSSNFLTPVSIGSTDGDLGEITPTEERAMAITVLDKDLDADGNLQTVVSSNSPKIVKTYRTSSQYFAAIDFIENIINKEAVSGMNVTRSANSSNAMFQSKFMSRAASLSLAENSLRNSVEIRTGSKINAAISKSTSTKNFDRNSEVVREGFNGAGALDVMIHLVDKDYNRLQSDAKSVIAGGGSRQLDTAPNKVLDWQIEALIKSNQLALMQFEQNERIELLLAALLANTTNAESNINHINSLKLK